MTHIEQPTTLPARPAVLLIHAFPLDASLWKPVADRLELTFDILAPDLLGFGEAPPAPGDVATMELLADAVASYCDVRGIVPQLVAGVSMGGYVALALLERRPDLVPRLVLADTRARADNDAERAGRSALIDALGAAAPREGELLARTMLPRLLAPQPDPALVTELRRRIETTSIVGARAALRGMAARPDRTEILREFQGPLALVCGEFDGAPTPHEMHALAKEIGRDDAFEVVAGAGHLAPRESPEAFAALVRRVASLPL